MERIRSGEWYLPGGDEPNARRWERARPITIGEDCWFGAGAMVMPGVTVGDRVVVAAGSVVTRDVPSDTLVAGVPATVKRSLLDAPPAPTD